MRQRQYTEGIKGFEVDIHKFIDDFVREVSSTRFHVQGSGMMAVFCSIDARVLCFSLAML